MSEEQDNTIDASVVPAAITETAGESADAPIQAESGEATATVSNDRPAGYDPVDVRKATPEQIQDRLDYLYKQVKPKERENREMRALLAEQSRVIDQLSQSQHAVVTHLTERSFADSETQLKEAMNQAWEKRDNRAYIDAQTKLNLLYVQQETAKTQRPQQQGQQQPQYRNAAEIANGAVNTGELDPEAYRATEVWQNERDGNGGLVRPWAYDNHPQYRIALEESKAVFSNPRYENLTYDQKLAEVDRRMGTQKRPTGQQVMGGSLTKSAKKATIELTPKQRDIALRTKYAGKDKSEADHLEAYRKQVEKFRTTDKRA